MRFVSLFAGIGGFDLAFERSGVSGVGQCEIDTHAAAVLRHHWPNTPRHDDVTTLPGDKFGPADIITFGSPCQDLSVAGRRAGLDGERSGLFTEAIRVAREMREATNGEYPKALIWENVPGAFSSNGGRDFAVVLRSLAELGAMDIRWSVLDSQYFGVPQRRRRVFVIAGFGGFRAAEVLSLPEGMPWDSPQGRTARQGASSGLVSGIEQSGRIYGTDGLAPSLGASDYKGSPKVIGGVTVASTVTGNHDDRGDGTDNLLPVLARALTTGGRIDGETEDFIPIAIPIALDWTASEARDPPSGRVSPTLEGQSKSAVAFSLRGRDGGAMPEVQGASPSALRSSGGGSTRDYVAFQQNQRNEVRLMGGDGNVAGRLPATPGMKQQNYIAGVGVRRLTPRECERLQGFPDDWTRFGNYGGEVREVSDTQRYKMLGNAVTVNVAEWIARRIMEKGE